SLSKKKTTAAQRDIPVGQGEKLPRWRADGWSVTFARYAGCGFVTPIGQMSAKTLARVTGTPWSRSCLALLPLSMDTWGCRRLWCVFIVVLGAGGCGSQAMPPMP